MATWTAVIVETRGQVDLWDRAGRHGVRSLVAEVPPYALIDCAARLDFTAPIRLAEAISRELAGRTIGFAMQTNADAYELCTFDGGRCVRALAYGRDAGGWIRVEGAHQPWWERAFFFGDATSTGDGANAWPDMLDDELSPEQIARYEAAKKSGVADPVLELLRPSSTAPMVRVCDALGIRPDAPHATWRPRSRWARWLGRS